MMRLLLAGLLLVSSMPAFAQQLKDGHNVALTPFVAYRVGGEFKDRDTDQRFDVDDSGAYGFVLGIPWTADSELEIYYSRQSTDVDVAGLLTSGNAIDLDFDTLQIGGTYFLDTNSSTLPFFVATAGGTRISPSGPGTKSDTFFSFGVGGGWHLFADKPVGVRIEGRAIGTFVDSSSSLFCGVNNGSGTCTINTSGDILWQFEAQAAIVYRF